MPNSTDRQELERIAGPLLRWYATNARDLPWRRDPTPYHVWLSEVMLQQTRVETVIPYYSRFLEALPDVPALAGAEEELLHKLWEGLGYYSRVRNMRRAAEILCERHGGALPRSYEALRALPGIGAYTAGAIGSIAFSLPVPAVDGNVLRVFSRLLASEEDVASPAVRAGLERLIADIIPDDAPGDFNQSLMELGATVCLPGKNPRCAECPVGELCAAEAGGIQHLLPVKSPKAPRRAEAYTVCVLLWRDAVYLRRRPEKGLLAGLWEPFVLEGTPDEAEVRRRIASEFAAPRRLTALKARKHIFTHVEWCMTAYLAELPPEGEYGGVWTPAAAPAEAPAISSAYRPILREALEILRRGPTNTGTRRAL